MSWLVKIWEEDQVLIYLLTKTTQVFIDSWLANLLIYRIRSIVHVKKKSSVVNMIGKDLRANYSELEWALHLNEHSSWGFLIYLAPFFVRDCVIDS